MLRSGGAQSLAQTDLAGALRHRDQHDVHDSHGPKGERHQADGSQERIHGVGNFADHLGVGDGIPIVERVGRLRIEVVISRNNAADRFLGLGVLLARNRLVDDIFDRLRSCLPPSAGNRWPWC